RRAAHQAARSLLQRDPTGPQLLMRTQRNARGVVARRSRRHQRGRAGDSSVSTGADNRSIRDRAKARSAESDSHIREPSAELSNQSGCRRDKVKRGRLLTQPPSLLSSLSDITEWQEPEAEEHQRQEPAL